MQKDYGFAEQLQRGVYFPKKKYCDLQPETFEEVRDSLPEPILRGRQTWLDCYWYAVRLAYRHIHTPTEESGFVSNFVDAAFNDDIFLWDTAFITMFCNLFHPYIPGIRSLDNFYRKQFEDGEIPRELVRKTGKDFPLWVNAYRKPLYSYFHNRYQYRGLKNMKDLPYEGMYKPDLKRKVEKNPYLTLDSLNHPILAWAEWESFLQTGDVSRLAMVYESLLHYYNAMKYHIRHANGLYVTDWASMDNSPRNRYLGCAVDTSCEMVLFARSLIDIVSEFDRHGLASGKQKLQRKSLETDARELADTINRLMWDEKKGFYFDLRQSGEHAPVKTIAAYWALVSGVADEKQAERLVDWLNDRNAFCRLHRVPVCPADEEGYDPKGGYWRGSVWAPTNMMVIRGLEKYGYHDLARKIALNDLDAVCRVFQKTGTIWENYPPDEISSGNADRRDFVGWSGIAPILFLMEYAVGLKADAPNDRVIWDLDVRECGCGCKNYWFGGKTADFFAEQKGRAVIVRVATDDSFTLSIRCRGNTYRYTVCGDLTVTLNV